MNVWYKSAQCYVKTEKDNLCTVYVRNYIVNSEIGNLDNGDLKAFGVRDR